MGKKKKRLTNLLERWDEVQEELAEWAQKLAVLDVDFKGQPELTKKQEAAWREAQEKVVKLSSKLSKLEKKIVDKGGEIPEVDTADLDYIMDVKLSGEYPTGLGFIAPDEDEPKDEDN